ncbi:MAG TPA: LLM class flavin-dependent oxidoreductase [Acidimicrobiia bacterium]
MPSVHVGVSSAPVQTLGAPFQVEIARAAGALGYSSYWIAEANATEGFVVLGAVAAEAPSLALGTGVLALQLRTPPLAAMAVATLQSLAPDRDVFLGIGISSPVVAGQWHGAQYGNRPIAQVREYVALVRECLSGETVTFQGDFYDVRRFRLGVRLGDRRPKIVIGALNPKMLATAGEIADGVLLNYLPASHVPWSVEQVRKGGDATIYAYIHCAVTDRDRYAEAGRKDLFGYAVVDAYADNFRRAGFGDDIDALRAARAAKDRDGAVAAIGDGMVDAIQIMGSADHVGAAVAEYVTKGVEVPIVFPCPWGEDRRATVHATMEAAIASLLTP